MKETINSGLFPLEGMPPAVCSDPEHNFPMHIYVPRGYGYTHVCPSCGYVQTVIPQPIWCGSGTFFGYPQKSDFEG